ncbi:WXG100 family type VII secretion target [Micromonospora sonneratiae]|uniref:PPE domain-containing protein n=1 Tax=Micromonospora sonneratiae TaxID=1184706 RepID=A0ABW3YCA1_9ACTN
MPGNQNHSRVRSDFSQHSHQELVRMLYASEPETVVAAARAWDAAGNSLHDRAGDVERQLREFEEWWDGGAARQYKSMINDLTSGIRRVADTAFAVRDLTYSSADALETARKAMPAPQAVPDLAPSVIAAATTPLILPVETPPATVEALHRQQSDAINQVKAHQQAQAAANAAHQQAVQVMTTLAGQYTVAEDSMPVAPTAASRPTTVPPDTQPAPGSPTLPPVPQPGVLPSDGTTPDPTKPVTPTTPPLFSTMFTAGLAAASAALGGRFTSMLPRLLPGNKTDDKKPATNLKDTSLGTGGAGGGGGGGGFGGGGGPDKTPVANQALAGQPNAPVASGLAGAAGMAAAAGAKGMAGGFMPAMPFAPMGAADAAGGRRIPPWLIETEDVWGEQSMVTPSVIGEDIEPAQNPTNNRPWS